MSKAPTHVTPTSSYSCLILDVNLLHLCRVRAQGCVCKSNFRELWARTLKQFDLLRLQDLLEESSHIRPKDVQHSDYFDTSNKRYYRWHRSRVDSNAIGQHAIISERAMLRAVDLELKLYSFNSCQNADQVASINRLWYWFARRVKVSRRDLFVAGPYMPPSMFNPPTSRGATSMVSAAVDPPRECPNTQFLRLE